MFGWEARLSKENVISEELRWRREMCTGDSCCLFRLEFNFYSLEWQRKDFLA